MIKNLNLLKRMSFVHKMIYTNQCRTTRLVLLFSMWLLLYLWLHYSNYLQKTFQKKVRKINNLFIVLLVLLFSHNILIFLMYMVSEIFDLKGRFISKVLRTKKNCLLFILIFSVVYILSSTLVLNFYDIKKIQILNFLFSFLIIFEICLKISQSERFILWIGENLDKSFRLFIMFIIGLNCTYFYTRLTLQIIESY